MPSTRTQGVGTSNNIFPQVLQDGVGPSSPISRKIVSVAQVGQYAHFIFGFLKLNRGFYVVIAAPPAQEEDLLFLR